MTVQCISAVTLAVQDMRKAVEFYQNKIGLEMAFGGKDASFTSFRVGNGHLNLLHAPQGGWEWWGRIIFHVDDVDALYQRLLQAGLSPTTRPQDAPWGERYFHINDPDGHELSFARPMEDAPRD